jgi:CspA family cold shock protein
MVKEHQKAGFCFDGSAARTRGAAFCCRGAPTKNGGLQHMAQGTVKWFNDDKGYGFISPDHGDVFVRSSDFEDAGFRVPQQGEKVTYEAA